MDHPNRPFFAPSAKVRIVSNVPATDDTVGIVATVRYDARKDPEAYTGYDAENIKSYGPVCVLVTDPLSSYDRTRLWGPADCFERI